MNPHKLPEKRVNPYEAPSVLGPSIRAAEMGIGVWRDGDLIVLHNDAELPPFCIVTGVPTPLQAMIEATWCYRSFEFRWKRRQLAVPLADHRRVWIVNSQTAIAFCLIAGFLLSVSIIGAMEHLFGWLSAALAYVLLLIAVVWVSRRLNATLHPLVRVHSDGPYHWLRGADEPFLSRLPHWKTYA